MSPPLCAILLVENQQIEKSNESPRDNQDPEDSEHGKRGIQTNAQRKFKRNDSRNGIQNEIHKRELQNINPT